ncbi:toll/interleukin-1 receptor domain-containing protein [Actinokineospora iranica]|uniref:TIR domain-containing protein n=1 Tax=Actinokineospora iranica TaxID=1271860 RepID=A0A1G6PI23_9PSEU|nr:TIR domain-containing protein [Actinokineospora iranica]SDC79224.1 TIR domain-containing protein [Actinokineospora iranica]
MSVDNAEYRYDVCLSFAGERRAYVERVAAALKARDVRVFYDTYEQANLWGVDLFEHLDKVYGSWSHFCVLFASREYAEKVWTSHERKSAQARAVRTKGDYILPARFDRTEIPGLRDTLGYIDLTGLEPEKLAELVVAKLCGAGVSLGQSAVDARPRFAQTPRSRAEIERLVATRHACWEYLLFGGEVLVGRQDMHAKLMDHEMGFATPGDRAYSAEEAEDRLRELMGEPLAILENLMRVFDERVQVLIFGRLGEAGDADKIRHAAGRFVRVFDELVDWALRTRGIRAPDEFGDVFQKAAAIADRPIAQINSFVDAFVSRIDRIPELVESGRSDRVEVAVPLEIAPDPVAIAELEAEINRVFERLPR